MLLISRLAICLAFGYSLGSAVKHLPTLILIAILFTAATIVSRLEGHQDVLKKLAKETK